MGQQTTNGGLCQIIPDRTFPAWRRSAGVDGRQACGMVETGGCSVAGAGNRRGWNGRARWAVKRGVWFLLLAGGVARSGRRCGFGGLNLGSRGRQLRKVLAGGGRVRKGHEPRNSYGSRMEFVWKSYGNPMEILWKSYGNPMEHYRPPNIPPTSPQHPASVLPPSHDHAVRRAVRGQADRL